MGAATLTVDSLTLSAIYSVIVVTTTTPPPITNSEEVQQLNVRIPSQISPPSVATGSGESTTTFLLSLLQRKIGFTGEAESHPRHMTKFMREKRLRIQREMEMSLSRNKMSTKRAADGPFAADLPEWIQRYSQKLS